MPEQTSEQIYQERLKNALAEKARLEQLVIETKDKVRAKRRKDRVKAVEKRIAEYQEYLGLPKPIEKKAEAPKAEAPKNSEKKAEAPKAEAPKIPK